MALFKISKGTSSSLGISGNSTYYAKEGFAYFTTDDGKMYIDIAGNGTSTIATMGTNRIALNAARADIATTVDDGAITNAKIANGTITNAKLAANTIGVAGNSLALGESVSKSDLRTSLGVNKIYYGTCVTAAATVEKAVTCTDFILEKGAIVFVTFDNTNSGAVANLKLNVNSTGAKPLKHWYNGSVNNLPGVGYLGANQTYIFYYDGTNWVTINNYNTNDNTKVT